MDAGIYSGKLYALNYVYTVYAVWLSRKQFEEKGWTLPVTWDDVMTIGEAAKAEDIALFPWGGQNASNYYRELAALSMAIKEGGVDVQKKLDRLEPDAFEQDSVIAAYAAIEDAVKAGYFLGRCRHQAHRGPGTVGHGQGRDVTLRARGSRTSRRVLLRRTTRWSACPRLS